MIPILTAIVLYCIELHMAVSYYRMVTLPSTWLLYHLYSNITIYMVTISSPWSLYRLCGYHTIYIVTLTFILPYHLYGYAAVYLVLYRLL